MFYFYLRERNSYDGIFFLFTSSSIFLFLLAYHLKNLSLTPYITKRNHVWNYHLIFFFCNLIIAFFLFRRCSTKEAAQRCISLTRYIFWFAILVSKYLSHLFLYSKFIYQKWNHSWRKMISLFYQKNLCEELYPKARHFIFWHSTFNCLKNLLTRTTYFHDSADDIGEFFWFLYQ